MGARTGGERHAGDGVPLEQGVAGPAAEDDAPAARSELGAGYLFAPAASTGVCLFSGARKALGWLKICKLAHTFRCQRWGYSHKRLKLAQLLGQLGVFLALRRAQS